MATVEVFIHSQWNKYDKIFSYTVYNCDMTEYGYNLVEVREVEFTTPTDVELRHATEVALRRKLQKVKAEAYAATQEIEQDIQELLALEAPHD